MSKKIEKESGLLDNLKNKLSWFFYSLTQPIYAKFNKNKKYKVENKSGLRRKELMFYAIFMLFPIIQFLIFYVYVNANSFVMAFRKYESTESSYVWVGLTNIKEVLLEIKGGAMLRSSITNSLLVYGLDLCMLPLQVFLPYYIYKKMPGAGFFKVMLFLPSVLSTMVLGLLYIGVMDLVIPELAEKYFEKMINPLLSGGTGKDIIVGAWSFSAIFGFASVLMYTGAMSRIPSGVVESAKLDGASPMQEFFKITLPLILPTVMVYVTTGIAAIFTNQVNLYTFFGQGARSQTVGYYIFINTLTSSGYQSYPRVAATGLIFSCIATPIMLLVRRLVAKISPEAEY